jgi:P4 family phage/plasmid primase-like protien
MTANLKLAHPAPRLDDLPVHVTIFEDLKAQDVKSIVATWAGIAGELEQPGEYPSKAACPLFVMATFGDTRTPKGSLRHDANVVTITGILGDYDAGAVTIGEAVQRLRSAGIEAALYTSASHTDEKPRWRVAAPLSKPHSPDEHSRLVDVLNGALGGILNGESWTRSQSYYIGRVAGRPYRCERSQGACLDEVAALELVAPIGKTRTEKSTTKPAGADDALEVADRMRALANVTPETTEELRSALAATPSDERDLWVRFGHALKSFPGGRDLWFEWSKKSAKFDPEDAERVWDSLSGERTDYRAVFAEAQRHAWKNPRASAAPANAEAPTRRPTEFGNAERMLDRYGEKFMFVPELDAWYFWQGERWQAVTAAMIGCLARDTVDALPSQLQGVASEEERARFLKWCATSQRASMVRSMVDLLAKDRRALVPAAALDPATHIIGAANGAIDLRTGALLAPDPALRLTLNTGTMYDPDARAPLFERTVLEVFSGDAEMAGFLQRLLGYSLLGEPREDLFVIPYGSGANGKSTIFNAVRAVLGEYARVVKAETFVGYGAGAASSAGGAREDLLRLRGARFVYIGEPEEGAELRESLVKSVTGGEPIPARGVYARSTIEILPTWTPFLPTNHRPIVKGDDHGIWRRLMPVPFLRNFDKEPGGKDPTRRQAVRAEAPGILRWIVQGALAYQRDGLRAPESVEAARRSYRDAMDLLRDWIEARCEEGPDFAESAERLWLSWEPWARANGALRYVGSKNALGRRLAARYGEPLKHGPWGRSANGYRGIRLRSEVTL